MADYAISDLSARNIWACEEPALVLMVDETDNASLVSDWQQSELRSTGLANLRPAQGDNGHSVVCCCRLDVSFFESPRGSDDVAFLIFQCRSGGAATRRR